MSTIKDFPSYIHQELNLDPPAAIPHADLDADADDSDSDGEGGRYELISFRLPVEMNVKDLNGVEIDLECIAQTPSGMKLKDGAIAIEAGDVVENQNFRILVPEKDDGDSDNNNNNNKYVLNVSNKPFSRHFNITANKLSHRSETELAPAQTPKAIDNVLRKAYCKIPQRKNLKRRWMPLGNPQVARDLPEKLVTLRPDRTGTRSAQTVSQSETSDDDDNDNNDKNKNNKKTKTKKTKSESNSDVQQEASAAAAAASPSKKKRIKKENTADSAAASAAVAATTTDVTVKSEKKKKKKEAKKQKEKLAKKSKTLAYKKQRSKDKKLVKKESKNEDDAVSV